MVEFLRRNSGYFNKVRNMVGAIALLTGSLAWGQPNLNYLRLEEYLELHPEQQAVTDSFAQRVRSEASPLSRALERPVRIAVIYPALQASDYWRRSVDSLEARLEELNVSHELNSFYSRPSIDVRLQSQQLQEALDWEPDYLIFTLDALRHKRMIERVLVRGRPKLILQNITTPLQRWQSHRPFLYVGFDHAIGSRQIAQRMLEQVQYRGKYLMLYFSDGYVSAMRGGTFAAEAARYPDIHQVASYYTDGNRAQARDATLRTIDEHQDLRFIFASSTDIALGAIDALRERNLLDQIMVNGWGGGAAELEALTEGALDLTVMRMNDDNGVAMAEAIKLDLADQPEAVPHVYSGDIRLIDRNTDATVIQQLKNHAFRYSGQ